MGSQNSRHSARGMEQNDDTRAQPATEEAEGDQHYLALLSYLVRSGQLRFIGGSADAGDEDDSDSAASSAEGGEEAEEEINMIYGLRSRSGFGRSRNYPKVPETFDTEVLDESDFKLQMNTQLGYLPKCQSKARKSLSKSNCVQLLHMKEAGLLGPKQNLSLGAQAHYGAMYLPNCGKQVHKSKDKVFCGTHSKDGELFLSASQDSYLRLFKTRAGSRLKLVKRIPTRDMGWSVLDTDFSPDGQYFVYAGWSNNVYLYGISNESERHGILKVVPEDDYRRSSAIFSVRHSNDGKELLAGTNNGFIYVYDLQREVCVNSISGHEDDVNSVAFEGSECNMLLSAGEDGLLKIWDRRTLCEGDPQPVGILSGHRDSLTFVDPKGDGRYVITNSKDQSIKLWDLRVMSSSSGVEATKEAVANQRWDYRWDSYRGNAIKPKLPGDVSLMTYYGHSVLQTLIRARFSPPHTTGQRYIYSGCGHGRVIVYDVLTGHIVKELIKHTSTVRDVSWHPFQNELLSSSWDGTICSWTYCGGACLE